MFLAGSDSEAEDDYYASAAPSSKHAAKSASTSSVLSSSNAARIAVHCNLRRVSREPPWLAALVAKRAEQERAVEEAMVAAAAPAEQRQQSRRTPTAEQPADSPLAATSQQRRRRNSITDALRVLLPGDRTAGAAGSGDESAEVEAPPSSRELLRTALIDAGFGQELRDEDTVVIGGDRVPRVLCKLGEALRKAGGIDEPRIFAHRPAPEEMLEVVRQLQLANVPELPRTGSAAGSADLHDDGAPQAGRPHAIAALMKEWLSQLPGGLLALSDAQLAEVYAAKEPLVPTRLRLDEMRGSLQGEAWRWFARFLAEVQQASPRNNMPARELAIVLAPLISRASTAADPASTAAAEGGSTDETVDECEREMFVQRFVQHSVAVMARKQLSLVRSPQANRRAQAQQLSHQRQHR